jgi:hypothetical protein
MLNAEKLLSSSFADLYSWSICLARAWLAFARKGATLNWRGCSTRESLALASKPCGSGGSLRWRIRC